MVMQDGTNKKEIGGLVGKGTIGRTGEGVLSSETGGGRKGGERRERVLKARKKRGLCTQKKKNGTRLRKWGRLRGGQ